MLSTLEPLVQKNAGEISEKEKTDTVTVTYCTIL